MMIRHASEAVEFVLNQKGLVSSKQNSQLQDDPRDRLRNDV